MSFCFVALFLAFATFAEGRSYGYSPSKLKSFQGHGPLHREEILGLSASDTGGTQYFYTGAIVDHFAPVQDQMTWIENYPASQGQRYFVNDEFFCGAGCPVFIYIGGEGPERASRLTDTLYMYELAEAHGALMLDLEHRYYGLSYPVPDMSTANMKYLTSAQALADVVKFIEYYNTTYDTSSSMYIAFGGSYAGNLASWLRLKYPHVFSGSIGSSAPLTAKKNFEEYMEVIGTSLTYYGGSNCYQKTAEAATQFAAYVTAKNYDKLASDFNICGEVTGDALDLWVFESDLMGNFQGTVQYNLESPTTFTTEDICTMMTNGDSPYNQFVKLSNEYLKNASMDCLDISWNHMINQLNNIKFDGVNASRQWIYQTCNEFGYYQTTDSSNQPFSSFDVNIQNYDLMCYEMFNFTVSPNIDWTNDYYGKTHIQGTNIAFPTGTIDPWHVLGIVDTTDITFDSDQSIYIVGTAHCADMHSAQTQDPSTLQPARNQVASRVSYYLTNDYNTECSNESKYSGNTLILTGILCGLGGVLIALCGTIIYFKRKLESLSPDKYSLL